MGKRCLECGSTVSFPRVIKALIPGLVKCEGCSARVGFNISLYIAYPLLIISMIVVALLSSYLATAITDRSLPGFDQQHIFFSIFIPLAILVYAAWAYWLLSYKGVRRR